MRAVRQRLADGTTRTALCLRRPVTRYAFAVERSAQAFAIAVVAQRVAVAEHATVELGNTPADASTWLRRTQNAADAAAHLLCRDAHPGRVCG